MIFYTVISVILLILIILYILKYRYTSNIRKVRDNIDFTTEEGKFMINELNKQLDKVNGYGIYNRE